MIMSLQHPLVKYCLALALFLSAGMLATAQQPASPGTTPAESPTDLPDWLQQSRAEVASLTQQLDSGKPVTSEQSSTWITQLQTAELQCLNQVQTLSNRLEEVVAQLDALGDATEVEDAEITKERAQLKQDTTTLTATINYCQYTLIRIRGLLKRIQAMGVDVFHETMLSREKSLWILAPAIFNDPQTTVSTFREALALSASSIPEVELRYLLMISALGLLVGWWFKRLLSSSHGQADELKKNAYLYNLGLHFRRKIPLLSGLVALLLMGLLQRNIRESLIEHLAMTLLILVVTLTFLKALLFSTKHAVVVRGWNEAQARTLYRLIRRSKGSHVDNVPWGYR